MSFYNIIHEDLHRLNHKSNTPFGAKDFLMMCSPEVYKLFIKDLMEHIDRTGYSIPGPPITQSDIALSKVMFPGGYHLIIQANIEVGYEIIKLPKM